MILNSKTIPENTIYNAILYYKNRSGNILGYALVISGESHEWKASGSKTSVRAKQIVVPFLEHHQDSISVSGKFLSQVDKNDFARFIRLWQKHSIGSTFVPLTFKYYKFTDKKKVENEINYFDCVIKSVDIGANLTDRAPSFNLSLMRLSDDANTMNKSVKISSVNANMPYYDQLAVQATTTATQYVAAPVIPLPVLMSIDWDEYDNPTNA